MQRTLYVCHGGVEHSAGQLRVCVVVNTDSDVCSATCVAGIIDDGFTKDTAVWNNDETMVESV